MIDPFPDILRLPRVEPDNKRRDLLFDHCHARRPGAAPHRRLTPTEQTRLVRVDLDQQGLPFLILTPRIGQGIGHLVVKADGFDTGDDHELPLQKLSRENDDPVGAKLQLD